MTTYTRKNNPYTTRDAAEKEMGRKEQAYLRLIARIGRRYENGQTVGWKALEALDEARAEMNAAVAAFQKARDAAVAFAGSEAGERMANGATEVEVK